jgi:hypothetical protein
MEGAFGGQVGEGSRAGADDVLSDRRTPSHAQLHQQGGVVVADAQEDVEQLGVELGAADPGHFLDGGLVGAAGPVGAELVMLS